MREKISADCFIRTSAVNEKKSNSIQEVAMLVPPSEVYSVNLLNPIERMLSTSAKNQATVEGYEWLLHPDTDTTIGVVGIGESILGEEDQLRVAERDAQKELFNRAAIIAGLSKPGGVLPEHNKVHIKAAKVIDTWKNAKEHTTYVHLEISKADFIKLITFLKQKYSK